MVVAAVHERMPVRAGIATHTNTLLATLQQVQGPRAAAPYTGQEWHRGHREACVVKKDKRS